MSNEEEQEFDPGHSYEDVERTEAKFEIATGIVNVCRWLVREYAAAHDFTTDNLRDDLTIRELVEYTLEKGLFDSSELQEACEQQGIPHDLILRVSNIWSDPYAACQLLMPLWPILAAPSEPLSAKPIFVTTAVTIGFDNDTAIELRANGITDESINATSGMVISLALSGMTVLRDLMMRDGIEQLRKQRSIEVEGLAEEVRRARESLEGK